MLSENMEALQQRAIATRLAGRDPHPAISIEYIVPDKRKRAKATRELLAKKFIEPDGENYRLTSTPYDVIEPHEPPLVTLALPPREQPYTEDDLQRRPGLPWNDLPPGAKKWVLEHPDDYRLFVFDAGWPYKPVDEYYAPGEVPDTSYGLYVKNDAYDEELARRRYALRFEAARGRNLAWGLQEQGLIEAVDADVFKTGQSGVPFGHGCTFHHDPAKWEEDMRHAIVSNRERIAKLTRETNILCAVQNALATRGGFEKFLETYDAALHAALTKEDEEECSD